MKGSRYFFFIIIFNVLSPFLPSPSLNTSVDQQLTKVHLSEAYKAILTVYLIGSLQMVILNKEFFCIGLSWSVLQDCDLCCQVDTDLMRVRDHGIYWSSGAPVRWPLDFFSEGRIVDDLNRWIYLLSASALPHVFMMFLVNNVKSIPQKSNQILESHLTKFDIYGDLSFAVNCDLCRYVTKPMQIDER